MVEQSKDIEHVLLARLLRLNATVQGLVAGTIAGLAVFLATNWLLIKGPQVGQQGEPVIGPHLGLLSQYFIGYRVSFLGSLIGLVYGFALGFIGGYFVAWLYNRIVDLREGNRSVTDR
jgi:hypothetical protein